MRISGDDINHPGTQQILGALLRSLAEFTGQAASCDLHVLVIFDQIQ